MTGTVPSRLGHRTVSAATRHPPARAAGRWARTALGLAALALVSGCAGESPFASLTPPNPEVPQVAPDAFPTLGTAQQGRPPPMTPEQRAKLQQELESLAKKRQRDLEHSLESNG